jgi:hypothetical protein
MRTADFEAKVAALAGSFLGKTSTDATAVGKTATVTTPAVRYVPPPMRKSRFEEAAVHIDARVDARIAELSTKTMVPCSSVGRIVETFSVRAIQKLDETEQEFRQRRWKEEAEYEKGLSKEEEDEEMKRRCALMFEMSAV